MSEENKAFARRLCEEAWNQYDPSIVEKFYAPNCVRHDPAGVGSANGIDEIKQGASKLLTAFPDSHYTFDDILAEGDKVVIRWTFRGTHKGELMGTAPTGKKVTATGIVISRIEGGRIVEDWINWDALGMMQQIGIVPPLGEY